MFFSIEEPPSLTPWKKRKTENDYNLCLICQEVSNEKVVKQPNIESFQKLPLITRDRAKFGDITVYEFFERSKILSSDDLVKSKACYHKKCYSEFTIMLKNGIEHFKDIMMHWNKKNQQL